MTVTFQNLTALTITSIDSLATSANGDVGAQTNSFNLAAYEDCRVVGGITVGTSPTANTKIELWGVGSISQTPTWPSPITGTAAARTWVSVGARNSAAKLLHTIAVDSNTSARLYNFDIPSLATIYKLLMPRDIAIFLTHNTGVNLSSSGNTIGYQQAAFS